MSRSYRHTPVVKDNKRHSKKWARKQANRVVRHAKGISNGSNYKKLYQQWDICDYAHRCTINDWYERWAKWCYSDDLYKNHPRYCAPKNHYGTSIQDAKRKWAKQYFWK
jgi:hypothetical protein